MFYKYPHLISEHFCFILSRNAILKQDKKGVAEGISFFSYVAQIITAQDRLFFSFIR